MPSVNLHKTKENQTKVSGNHCSVCFKKLPPDGLFCLYCDPPLEPAPVPDSLLGIRQTLLQTVLIIFLFLGIVVFKFNISLKQLFFEKVLKQTSISSENISEDTRIKVSYFVDVHMANVRKSPSLKGTIIMVLTKGETVNIGERQDEWSQINIHDKSGWIRNSLLKPVPVYQNAVDPDFQVIHFVKVRMANVRTKPSLKGRIIMVLARGAEINIIHRREKWSQISVHGKAGWIGNSLLGSKVQ